MLSKAGNVQRVCGEFNLSRQAYYQSIQAELVSNFTEEIIIQKVKELRKIHKRRGTRKLFEDLTDFFTSNVIKIGRDALFDLLRINQMLVRRRKSRVITTDSKHRYKKYPNLIRELEVYGPNKLWVSDITYVRYGESFAYLSLITDVYSRKIVGFNLSKDLKSTSPIRALKMAIAGTEKRKLEGLIHHSDRGVQYCCDEYVKMLKDNCIRISMTENPDPLENAVAERVNGIIKNEYELEVFKSYNELSKYVVECIFDYNNFRRHNSVENMTPNEAHQQTGQIQRKWKNYWKQNKETSMA